MNHAFLILAHDSPDLLQRLVDRIQADNHYVFIHLDKKSNDPKVNIKWGGYISDKKRINVNWGGFSMIRAEILLLKEALKSPIHFDYFHLISGHDYPCVNKKVFDSYFEECPKGRSFMHYDTDSQHIEWKEKISNRINKWHFHDHKNNLLICRAYRSFLLRYVKRKYQGELYAGWNWFSWHRSLAEWVLEFKKWHPLFFRRFHDTDCSDEVLFHTLLYSHIDELNIDRNNSLRYIDWYPDRPADSLPLILDERDYDSIKESGCLFCRKVFLEKSSCLLDLLDATCLDEK